MLTKDDFTHGWNLRLAEDADPRPVPLAVRDALPIPAKVPGTVHLDLLRANLLADPYIDRNELTQDWVGRTDWIYERTFDVPQAWLAETGTETTLEFDGLDTVATVIVNGQVLARTENMHRRYRVPITGALKAGSNTVQVRFDSAWRYAQAYRERVGEQPNQYPSPFAFIRKSACNFGWDWGPTLVTAGIWRGVHLVRHAVARLAAVRPTAGLHGPDGRLDVTVQLEGDTTGLRLVAEVAGEQVSVPVDAITTSLRIDVPEPRLWWPVGLGEQNLYDVEVRLLGPHGTLDTWNSRIGFRSVRLATEPDQAGSSFAFEVNGVTLPIRGANWIPDDCFLPRVDEARLRRRLGQARDANMNLVRVWGGGVYESEEFYRVCDELGLLVWQDFLFACAGYPEDEPLHSEIEAEARDNVERLMPHPSLVLWNGNNENIWGYFDWNWQPLLDGRPWGLEYYLELLPAVVADVDPSRPYWAGSPYSGSMDIHPNDENHGCMHVWDVWNEVDYTVYRNYRPRFASEFGWQAPPTWATLTRAIRDQPLTPRSPAMLHHQKAEDGNGKLERGLSPHFAVPAEMADWHFAMQLNQARALRLGIEHFRSLRPHNQGAIVWQLNDCWPVTSWAAIDGDGRRKPLWYALRTAFNPRLLTIQPDDENLVVVGVNDGGETWRETVTVQRVDFDGHELATYSTRLAVDRFGAARVKIPQDVSRPTDPTSELLVATTVTGERTEYFYAEDKDLRYQPTAVHGSMERDQTDALVTITAQTLVRDLTLFPDRLSPTAEADVSLVTLLPGETVEIRVRGLPVGAEDGILSAPVLRAANDLVIN